MRWFASILIIPAFTGVALAQTSQPAVVDANELIQHLGREDWRERQTAQDALVQLGDAATAALAATTQSATDEETRSRAAAALAQIAEDRAIGASRITLHLHNVTPKAAFEQLAVQARAPLEPITPIFWQQSSSAPISVDLDHVPFWRAMQALSEQTGVYLQEWNTGLRLASGPLIAGPQYVSDSYLVTADSLSRNQSVTFGPSAEHTDQMTMNLMLMAEPKLRVLRSTQAVTLTEAIDENGNSLLPDEKPDAETTLIGDAARWNCTAELRFPKRNPGTRLASLRGAIKVTLVSRIEQIVFSSLEKDRPTLTTAEGIAVTLKGFSKLANNQTEVILNVVPPGGASNNSDLNDQMSRPNAAMLFDSSNHPASRESIQIGGDAGHIELTLRFSTNGGEDGTRVGDADHLVVQIVGATKEKIVPFEFRDLPLP